MHVLGGLRRLSPRDSRGQSLALVLVMLPTLFGVGAVATDTGNWYVKQRKAQSAADAAVMAGAQLLTGDPAACANAITAAQASLTKNLSGATLEAACPYDSSQDGVTGVTIGSAYQLKVTVRTTAPTYFGRLVGFGQVNVSASAIGARARTTAAEGIFANGGPNNPETPGVGCGKEESGFYMQGSNASIGGAIVSNGTFQVIGSGNQASAGTFFHNNPNDCTPAVAAGNLFGGESQPARDPQLETFPIDFGCTIENAASCVDEFSCSQWASNPASAPADVHFPELTPKGKPPVPTLATQNWNIQSNPNPTQDQHGTVLVVNGQLSPGIYCNTAIAGGCGHDQCNIKIDINKGVTCLSPCTVTFVADKVELYQPNASYQPYQNGVVAFGVPKPGDCSANHEIHFSADNASWTGILYAPCGDIEFGQGAKSSGPGDTGSTVDNVHCTACVIEGRYVEIHGNGFTMNDGVGPPIPVGSPKLLK